VEAAGTGVEAGVEEPGLGVESGAEPEEPVEPEVQAARRTAAETAQSASSVRITRAG